MGSPLQGQVAIMSNKPLYYGVLDTTPLYGSVVCSHFTQRAVHSNIIRSDCNSFLEDNVPSV